MREFTAVSAHAQPRLDVQRNDEAILSAAIAVLAESPLATMNDIARASGLGRSTLYRHYPDRAALLAAIYERVRSEVRSIIDRQLDARPAGEPLDVLVELGVALAGLGDRYPFIERDEAKRHARRAGLNRRSTRIARYLRSAQRVGGIRADLDDDWLLSIYLGVVASAARHRFAGTEDRRRTIERTLRALLATPD